MISIYRTNHHYMVEANARRSSFVIDVRYYKSNPWSCMSPFFKWGDVPVRFSAPDTAISIAAMIEGLRVNQYHEHDPNLFHSLNFSDYLESERIKDSSGFLRGIGSHVILSPEEAHKELLYPTYRWVLDHKLNNQINAIRAAESYQDVVILDYPKVQSIFLYGLNLSYLQQEVLFHVLHQEKYAFQPMYPCSLDFLHTSTN